MKLLLLFLNVFFIGINLGEKEYIREFYTNKKLKSEGWMQDNKKQDYWFFYSENGSKKEEGHFENDKKTNWWIYYNAKNKIVKKCEYKNDKLNGFTIIYKDNEIVKAEKYSSGKKMKEWESIAEFKKDNTDLF